MTDTSDPAPPAMPPALMRLATAVDALEAAARQREAQIDDHSRKLMQARAETEALRELHEAVTQRLESAIARLRDAVGD